jgi:UDP-N-acetyl-D-glucosamine dehydrogenase
VELVRSGLNDKEKAIRGSKVLLLGVAYKKDIDDVRESPALDVMRLLENQGARVDFFDPLVQGIKWNGKKKKGMKTLDKVDLADFDAVVILTEHSGVDYDAVMESGTLIVDTRNVYDGIMSENIVKLGVS